MLTRRQETIRVREHGLSPASFSLYQGGCVRLAVESGPPQSFLIARQGRRVAVTPQVPAGEAYTWEPAEVGHYTVTSEIYERVAANVQVVPEEADEEGGRQGPMAAGRFALSPWAASGTGVAGGAAAEDVDTRISLPGLGRPAAAAHTGRSTAAGAQTVPVATSAYRDGGAQQQQQQQQPGSHTVDPADDEEAREGATLRRRSVRSASGGAGAPADASAARAASWQQQQQQAQPLRRGAASDLGVDSAADTGSSGSSRSWESYSSLHVPGRSRKEPPHSFQRQPSYGAASIGSGSYSDAGSSETVPLLYDARSKNKHLQQQQRAMGSFAPSAPPVGAAPVLGADKPASHRCPRCRKEFLSTINQRRCIASHLGGKQTHGGGAAGAAGAAVGRRAPGMPDAAALAAFWDTLSMAQQREVLNVRAEQWDEHIVTQVHATMLHREREGVLQSMADSQKRMHSAGLLLHRQARGDSGLVPLTGAQLVKLLSALSEGTFLYDRNTVNRDEYSSGNNLEAGLGALVTKRLVDAHLAAKARDAERLQRELEEQEEEQKAKAQAAGAGQQQAGKRKQEKRQKAKQAAVARQQPKAKGAAAAGGDASSGPASGTASDAEAEPAAGAGGGAVASGGVERSQQLSKPDEEGQGAGELSPPAAHARYSRRLPEPHISISTNALFGVLDSATTEEWELTASADAAANGGWHPAAPASGSIKAAGACGKKAAQQQRHASATNGSIVASGSSRPQPSSRRGVSSSSDGTRPTTSAALPAPAARANGTTATAAVPVLRANGTLAAAVTAAEQSCQPGKPAPKPRPAAAKPLATSSTGSGEQFPALPGKPGKPPLRAGSSDDSRAAGSAAMQTAPSEVQQPAAAAAVAPSKLSGGISYAAAARTSKAGRSGQAVPAAASAAVAAPDAAAPAVLPTAAPPAPRAPVASRQEQQQQPAAASLDQAPPQEPAAQAEATSFAPAAATDVPAQEVAHAAAGPAGQVPPGMDLPMPGLPHSAYPMGLPGGFPLPPMHPMAYAQPPPELQQQAAEEGGAEGEGGAGPLPAEQQHFYYPYHPLQASCALLRPLLCDKAALLQCALRRPFGNFEAGEVLPPQVCYYWPGYPPMYYAGPLPPFPPGMPVPLSAEDAAELEQCMAATAVQQQQQQDAAEEQGEWEARAEPEAEQPAQQEPAQQDAAAAFPAGREPPTARPSFAAMLREALMASAPHYVQQQQQEAAEPPAWRSSRQQGFDAAAALEQFRAEWDASVPHAPSAAVQPAASSGGPVGPPSDVAAVPSQPQQPHLPASAARFEEPVERPLSRCSSGGSGSWRSGSPSFGASAGSRRRGGAGAARAGRADWRPLAARSSASNGGGGAAAAAAAAPGAGGKGGAGAAGAPGGGHVKPVVVAVRAWSTEDSSEGQNRTPKWTVVQGT
eukprot:scaffold12.g7971.t1